jgi:hypothetical protein
MLAAAAAVALTGEIALGRAPHRHDTRSAVVWVAWSVMGMTPHRHAVDAGVVDHAHQPRTNHAQVLHTNHHARNQAAAAAGGVAAGLADGTELLAASIVEQLGCSTAEQTLLDGVAGRRFGLRRSNCGRVDCTAAVAAQWGICEDRHRSP